MSAISHHASFRYQGEGLAWHARSLRCGGRVRLCMCCCVRVGVDTGSKRIRTLLVLINPAGTPGSLISHATFPRSTLRCGAELGSSVLGLLARSQELHHPCVFPTGLCSAETRIQAPGKRSGSPREGTSSQQRPGQPSLYARETSHTMGHPKLRVLTLDGDSHRRQGQGELYLQGAGGEGV